jgi:hypothetical protein
MGWVLGDGIIYGDVVLNVALTLPCYARETAVETSSWAQPLEITINPGFQGDPSPRDRRPENKVIDVIDVIVGGYCKLGTSCCAFFRWVWFDPAIEMS